MNAQAPIKIAFDPDAVARFTELAQDILTSVKSFGDVEVPTGKAPEIHPVAHINSDDIQGEIRVQGSLVNALGEEAGRFWTSNGLRVGWQGADFDAIKSLATKLETAESLKGRVSHSFLLDEAFKWLSETLEQQQSAPLCDYIAERCSTEIREYEIWVPVFRTYSARDFWIEDVEFRTVSKALLDKWYGGIPKEMATRPEIAIEISRKRARIQAAIAACVHIRAEARRASEVAQGKASDAIAMLRFLSPMNWTCKRVSHCLPVGRENTRQAMELLIEDGAIKSQTESTIDEGPSGWNIDEARLVCPDLLEALHKLAIERKETEFKDHLYRALQLHSRNNIATEVPHKILFVVAAIESLLLRDSQEPIQKNLGERMAFVIGNSLRERKSVVDNVSRFYRLRSALFHHGQSVRPADAEVVDKFFFNVWSTISRLLAQANRYETKERLIQDLEDRKLS